MNNKVASVTGASSGIGRATAWAFATMGVTVSATLPNKEMRLSNNNYQGCLAKLLPKKSMG